MSRAANAAALVGVVGAGGAVGRAVVRELSRRGTGPLRLGIRGALPASLAERASEVWPEPVDVDDAIGLRRFCEGCEVVVNCAGPTARVGYRVGIAAAAAGAHWVDVNDLAELGSPPSGILASGRVAVTAAGLMPGLSGLLVRVLLEGRGRPGARLTAYAGGLLAFAPAAALDFMRQVARGEGAATAIFRAGRREQAALGAERDVALPFFRGRVTAVPYLTAEAERLARTFALAEARWLTVFAGPRTLRVIERDRGGSSLEDLASALRRASRADLAGQHPYQALTYQLAVPDGRGGADVRSLAVTLTDATQGTAAAGAMAVDAVLQGALAPGVHPFADAVDASAAWEALRTWPCVTGRHRFDGPLTGAPSEEAAL